jgi:uncharacterized glyoxalase superfamily protein PhnB
MSARRRSGYVEHSGFESACGLRITEFSSSLAMPSMVAIELPSGQTTNMRIATHAVMVRVADVRAHHDRAKTAGARITNPPTDYPFGERQYSALDLAGHRWTFSESIADIDPGTWGGELLAP